MSSQKRPSPFTDDKQMYHLSHYAGLVKGIKRMRFRLIEGERGEVASECARAAVVTVTRAFDKVEAHNFENTIVDARFGKESAGVHKGVMCAQCGKSWRECTMHAGAMKLPEPVMNPWLRKGLKHVLQCCSLTRLSAESRVVISDASGVESGHLFAYYPTQGESDAGKRTRRIEKLAAATHLSVKERMKMMRDDNKPKPRGSKEDKCKRGISWLIDERTGSIHALEFLGDEEDEEERLPDQVGGVPPPA